MKDNFKKAMAAVLIIVCMMYVLVVRVVPKWNTGTCGLKVHFIDVKGDATLIQYNEGKQTHYGMIDVGQKASDKKNAAAYFAGVADKAKQDRVLDFCIIIHVHRDHYYGLRYLKEYDIKVKKLYVNSLFYDESTAEGEIEDDSSTSKKKTLKEFIDKVNQNNVLVDEENYKANDEEREECLGIRALTSTTSFGLE